MEITHAQFQLLTGMVLTVLFFAFVGVFCFIDQLTKKK